MKFHLDAFKNAVRVFAPIVLPMIPHGDKIAPLIPTITGAIEEAEAIKGASGAEKKAHVLAIVQAGVATANATGHVTLNPAEVGAIASNGIDAVIGAVKAVEQAHGDAPPLSGPTAPAA